MYYSVNNKSYISLSDGAKKPTFLPRAKGKSYYGTWSKRRTKQYDSTFLTL